MDNYLPVFVLFSIATAFALFSIAMSALVGPRRYNRAKLDSYECGIQPAAGHEERGRIPVRYYTIAMTFIIFDVELMFLIPWAVHFDALGGFGLVAILLFLSAISIAYAYEWRRGGLDWD